MSLALCIYLTLGTGDSDLEEHPGDKNRAYFKKGCIMMAQTMMSWDFLGGPAFKTLSFQCRRCRELRSHMLHSGAKKQKERKKQQYLEQRWSWAKMWICSNLEIIQRTNWYSIRINLNSRLPWWLRQRRIYLQCERPGFDPWVRKILGEGNGNPLQYSCLENSMDRGAWRATVYKMAKSQIWLSK